MPTGGLNSLFAAIYSKNLAPSQQTRLNRKRLTGVLSTTLKVQGECYQPFVSIALEKKGVETILKIEPTSFV